jgi:hypothetical protein
MQTHYQEILKQISERDNISFKLLAFVPSLSGVFTFLTIREDAGGLPLAANIVIGLLGASITFFIWRWERRNIQFCTILRKSAAAIEQKWVEDGLSPCRPFADLIEQNRPSILGLSMGKTEAEAGIYISTILLWLSLPVLSCIA